ncbi:hypothetical protein DFJ73DRAFT_831279 [Zopfochytrium polystomum]|nr:hypothetical protein DFJ73DRAFT_831279 [Zopfochytrium polystomum]
MVVVFNPNYYDILQLKTTLRLYIMILLVYLEQDRLIEHLQQSSQTTDLFFQRALYVLATFIAGFYIYLAGTPAIFGFGLVRNDHDPLWDPAPDPAIATAAKREASIASSLALVSALAIVSSAWYLYSTSVPPGADSNDDNGPEEQDITLRLAPPKGPAYWAGWILSAVPAAVAYFTLREERGTTGFEWWGRVAIFWFPLLIWIMLIYVVRSMWEVAGGMAGLKGSKYKYKNA